MIITPIIKIIDKVRMMFPFGQEDLSKDRGVKQSTAWFCVAVIKATRREQHVRTEVPPRSMVGWRQG